MKFGTELNTELMQKYVRVKVQNDIRTSKMALAHEILLTINITCTYNTLYKQFLYRGWGEGGGHPGVALSQPQFLPKFWKIILYISK